MSGPSDSSSSLGALGGFVAGGAASPPTVAPPDRTLPGAPCWIGDTIAPLRPGAVDPSGAGGPGAAGSAPAAAELIGGGAGGGTVGSPGSAGGGGSPEPSAE